jgi:hypothetical protein
LRAVPWGNNAYYTDISINCVALIKYSVVYLFLLSQLIYSSTSTQGAQPDTSNGGLNESDKIGVGVGVSFGVVAVIGVIVAFFAWKYPTTAKRTKDDVVGRFRQVL